MPGFVKSGNIYAFPGNTKLGQDHIDQYHCILTYLSYCIKMWLLVATYNKNYYQIMQFWKTHAAMGVARLEYIMLLKLPIILSSNSFIFTYYSQNYSLDNV